VRVGFVVYGDLEQVTGSSIYDRLVVEQLRQLGDQVSVVSLSPGAAEPPGLSGLGLDVVVADEACFRELPRLFAALPPKLRRVLLIHHLTAWEHPPGGEHQALLAAEEAAILAADTCVVTSRVTADRLQQERLVRRVTIAEPGADRLPRARTAGQEPSGALLRVLFIGNILRRTRVFELLQAFADLPYANAELVLVGAELEPDYAAEVRALLAEPELGRRVHFCGALGADGVAEQLALADVLVLPSRLEGYGMVLSEALWAAVPVIAARVGAAEELVSRTEAGLLFDAAEQAGLAAALATFVSDADLRRRLRKAAWEAADRLPRWRDTALALRSSFTA
jgi:glycosyltransferase involved in cell wall biosynthesis